mmetsp:Transcript_4168/g.11189  ORF Transcript_4168/g.11189 Transcript_4168/m.11189 type:complete len:267 (-) Transcript_4168:234-1034(-)
MEPAVNGVVEKRLPLPHLGDAASAAGRVRADAGSLQGVPPPLPRIRGFEGLGQVVQPQLPGQFYVWHHLLLPGVQTAGGAPQDAADDQRDGAATGQLLEAGLRGVVLRHLLLEQGAVGLVGALAVGDAQLPDGFDVKLAGARAQEGLQAYGDVLWGVEHQKGGPFVHAPQALEVPPGQEHDHPVAAVQEVLDQRDAEVLQRMLLWNAAFVDPESDVLERAVRVCCDLCSSQLQLRRLHGGIAALGPHELPPVLGLGPRVRYEACGP